MVGKEDVTVPKWVKSYLRFLQIIPTSGGDPDYEVGFALAFEGDIPSAELRCWGLRKSLQRSLDPRWENPILE